MTIIFTWGSHGRNWEKNLEGVEIHAEGTACAEGSRVWGGAIPLPSGVGSVEGPCPLFRIFF